MDFLDLIDEELSFQRNLHRQFKKLGRIKTSGTLLQTIKKNGYKEYYIRRPGETREHYVRKKDMSHVYKLKLKAFADFGAARTAENIRMLQALREEYRLCDFASVNQDIEPKYRLTENTAGLSLLTARSPVPQSENPKYREELKHSTTFGLMVRSKNEAQIAEMLMAAGLEFYYEKALILHDSNGNRTTIYPDFTIVLPSGYTVYWEHKGRLDDAGYIERDSWKTNLYHQNGIYQPHNLIVTCDGPRGEFPGVEIGLIISKILRELAVSRL